VMGVEAERLLSCSDKKGNMSSRNVKSRDKKVGRFTEF
jgi:hypothetical protein